jgi:glycosyltransferase involved in cell wall biosynthesis
MSNDDCDLLFEKTNPKACSSELTSVAVSLFNYERFIVDCLNSVLRQTALNIELIVVDDASNSDRSCDAALDWMKKHAARFQRAILLRHRKNRGLAEARNTAFRAATSEFVFVLDADNMIYPRAIARLSDALLETGDGAAYTQLEFFDAEQRLGYGDIWNKEYFKRKNYVDAMALVRKASWEAVGGYTHIEGGWEDYDFWCKFIEHGISAIFVPEILCRYRVHHSSMLRTVTNKKDMQLRLELNKRHPWLLLEAV